MLTNLIMSIIALKPMASPKSLDLQDIRYRSEISQFIGMLSPSSPSLKKKGRNMSNRSSYLTVFS